MSDKKNSPPPLSPEEFLAGLKNIVIGLTAFGIVAFVVAYLVYWCRVRAWPTDAAALGQLGDFIGGNVNPVLSFLTLFAVVLTVVMQGQQIVMAKRELENSKAELQETRAELQRTVAAQERTAEAMHTTASQQAATAMAVREQAKYANASARAAALQAALAAVTADLAEERLHAVSDLGRGGNVIGELREKRSKLTAQLLALTDDLLAE